MVIESLLSLLSRVFGVVLAGTCFTGLSPNRGFLHRTGWSLAVDFFHFSLVVSPTAFTQQSVVPLGSAGSGLNHRQQVPLLLERCH